MTTSFGGMLVVDILVLLLYVYILFQLALQFVMRGEIYLNEKDSVKTLVIFIVVTIYFLLRVLYF